MGLAYCLAILATIFVRAPLPAEGSTAFTAGGQSQHWSIHALFTRAEWDAGEVGYEFAPVVTYLGPEERLYWYRIEPLFPHQLTLRARPNPPVKRGGCVVDLEFSSPEGEGAIFPVGRTYNHGNCNLYPWTGGGRALADLVSKGLYFVAWEDQAGVHAEEVPLEHIQFER